MFNEGRLAYVWHKALPHHIPFFLPAFSCPGRWCFPRGLGMLGPGHEMSEAWGPPDLDQVGGGGAIGKGAKRTSEVNKGLSAASRAPAVWTLP